MLQIDNPKPQFNLRAGRATWYPYYAGFSGAFAESLVLSLGLTAGSCIVDPWNGSGTTTATALKCGYSSCGFDLNPAMVVVSKARLLSGREKPSLLPIAYDIVARAKAKPPQIGTEDPLLGWFVPRSVVQLRAIEAGIQNLLIDPNKQRPLTDGKNVTSLSDLAAFFYTALFRTLRKIGSAFGSSNPTWLKLAKTSRQRLRPGQANIMSAFLLQTSNMVSSMGPEGGIRNPDASSTLSVASSEAIPLKVGSADFVLSSPPYCTRLDYAVATRLELALLGYSTDEFSKLRRSLIGSATVKKVVPGPLSIWGTTCNAFLEQVITHASKASHSYYYKHHVQYFRSLWNSLVEISRILKPGGVCSLVVQDSYYKNIHNDLPQILAEMAKTNGLSAFHRADFRSSRNLARINPEVRNYRSEFHATESVLSFRKG